MKKILKLCSAFKTNTNGATAIEYALIATGISIAIIVGYSALTNTVENTYTTISNEVEAGLQ